MLTRLCRLALEVKYVGSAREFYETRLGLVPADESDTEVAYDVGETTLVLRRPTAVPRGGIHTHYAFSTTREAYEGWVERFSELDPVEFSFGSSRSVYVYDPDGNCVEVGGTESADSADAGGAVGPDGAGPLTGIFEVVLEVADVDRAEERYRALGFEVVDEGAERRRVRLSGPVDIELWEPQLGIADARGGVHVDLTFAAADAREAVDAGAPWADGPEDVDGGLRVRDANGHVLTFRDGRC
ncbi:fosmidomycin resistance protein [Halopelagius longus]|uniref:Catechol-2,3-dioxygenase n=1 Tax=Halopelagius longus TaxID=1236180 RepID=A0A1H1AQU7_9EURY|nr:fosmidomycin resistance protein [Halopelagius longus]RDI70465.1 fosmidomycin resistance protein [Halopelagius longus]SDQ41546.1 Catechol-2,3-dioxygenase [Halopelagius longus]